MEGGIPFAVGADVPALDDKHFWARLQAWREEALPGCGLDVDPIHHATVKFILLVGRLRFLILSCVITKPYGVRRAKPRARSADSSTSDLTRRQRAAPVAV